MYSKPFLNAGAGGAAGPTALKPIAQMASTRRTTRALFAVAGLLLAGACGGFYMLNTQIQSIPRIEADKEAQVGSAQQVARRFDATQADYAQTKAQLRFLEDAVPANAYVPTLLPQLQKLAAAYGCQVTSIKPGAVGGSAPTPAASGSAVAAPLYDEMPLTLALTGSYSQVMHFVYSLTRFEKVLTVKTIGLHPGTAGPATPGVKLGAQPLAVDLDLVAYVFRDNPRDRRLSDAPKSTAVSLGSVSANRAAQSDVVGETMIRPVAAAQGVQSASQERVTSAGLTAQPAPPTMPVNPAFARK